MLKEHKAFIAKESKSDVLILILMEHAQRNHIRSCGGHIWMPVLILILMEHAQRVNREFKGIDAYEKS